MNVNQWVCLWDWAWNWDWDWVVFVHVAVAVDGVGLLGETLVSAGPIKCFWGPLH